MTIDQQPRSESQLASALSHLQSALVLLDAVAAPPSIGARLDHVIHQLNEFIVDEQAQNRAKPRS